ncbi:hypothetical protein DAPPUDRAFT_236080 [Daphnia pulex]|uniref:Uncharacterized protein n=1 Tax=Daphnia pulex TaxID=6669 RepID=E9FZX1_DAPPU|nr:hypothetical protein DAPPUDRAFT_236080 [Daphnia pulex]|eukprot:EFX87122.1 hypothetical protein DAPPUDRAFT_236080 [Daphnia pulex]
MWAPEERDTTSTSSILRTSKTNRAPLILQPNFRENRKAVVPIYEARSTQSDQMFD